MYLKKLDLTKKTIRWSVELAFKIIDKTIYTPPPPIIRYRHFAFFSATFFVIPFYTANYFLCVSKFHTTICLYFSDIYSG